MKTNGGEALLASKASADTNHKLLTAQEVADLLQVPRSWVYTRTRKRGIAQLPHLKLGKYIHFEESSIREFLDRQRRA